MFCLASDQANPGARATGQSAAAQLAARQLRGAAFGVVGQLAARQPGVFAGSLAVPKLFFEALEEDDEELRQHVQVRVCVSV